jgi:hypothetical protein
MKPDPLAPEPALAVRPQVPTLNIELTNTNVQVGPHPADPDTKLMVVGPVLVHFLLPLESDAAREIQAALGNGLVLAAAGDLPR